ncbi:MAG: UDP-N-acetylglucosamine 2-epimerase [Nanoarchaeota archaeon]|nr:UDP-N-acetylglucosamine 2-epimerase [DPANN group archaeon]MBL7116685.1 UDP-N-acetylglucosamine 2-epimerase [Nanoarchaeota archaeon]
MHTKIVKKDILDFLEGFSFLRVNDKTIQESLNIDGYSLWWFIKPSLVSEYVPLNRLKFENVTSLLNENKSLFLYNFKGFFHLFFYRKMLCLSELLKILISKKKVIGRANKKTNRILFLTHTNALKKKGSKFELDRVESLRKVVDEAKGFSSKISVAEPLSRNSLFGLRNFPNLIYSYASFKIILDAWKLSRKFSRKVKNFFRKSSFKDSDREVFKALKPLIGFFFSREYIFLTILYYKVYYEILKQEKIDFLFLYSTSDIFSRCAMAASDKLDIYSGIALHGIGFGLKRPELPKNCLYFVPGELYKDKLENLGVARKNIYLTGALFLSDVYNYKPVQKKQGKVLFLTSPFIEYKVKTKEEYLELIKKMFLAFKKFEDTEFLVKSHPNERFVYEYSNIIRKLNIKNIKILSSGFQANLYDLINKTDFMISFGSTASFEALILKKPSIIINVFGKEVEEMYQPILQSKNVFVQLTSADKLENVLSSALSSNSFFSNYLKEGEKFINNCLAFNDNKVNERIFETIRKFV